MKVLIYVEGPTEEAFVNNCLAPYLLRHEIYITPVVISTKVLLNGGKIVGGLTNGNLPRFLKELNKLIYSVGENGLVTTFIDYYALPNEFPGYDQLTMTMRTPEKIDFLQNSLSDYFEAGNRFVPFIMMHEFEALIFSHSAGFLEYVDPAKADVASLIDIVNSYENPELINDKKETSPSHRILNFYPSFKKPLMGNMMLLEIGSDIRENYLLIKHEIKMLLHSELKKTQTGGNKDIVTNSINNFPKGISV